MEALLLKKSKLKNASEILTKTISQLLMYSQLNELIHEIKASLVLDEQMSVFHLATELSFGEGNISRLGDNCAAIFSPPIQRRINPSTVRSRSDQNSEVAYSKEQIELTLYQIEIGFL